MRISVEPGDRAFDASKGRRVSRVLVDGAEWPAVLTADEEEGLVRAIAIDPVTGGPRTLGDAYQIVEVRGRVVVEMDETRWDADRKGDGTRVEVGRAPDGSIHVHVHSWARPGAIRRGVMDPKHFPTDPRLLAQRVGVVAGGLAEDLCSRFGDRLDPSDVARVALEQASLMLADEARAG